MDIKKNRRRYYLHNKVRKAGFKLITKNKTIYSNNTENLPASVIKLMVEYGYAVQTYIA